MIPDWLTPEIVLFVIQFFVNGVSVIVGYSSIKTKVALMEERFKAVEHDLARIPETYVTMGMFRDFMNRMDSGMTEVRQDIKTLIGLASKK